MVGFGMSWAIYVPRKTVQAGTSFRKEEGKKKTYTALCNPFIPTSRETLYPLSYFPLKIG